MWGKHCQPSSSLKLRQKVTNTIKRMVSIVHRESPRAKNENNGKWERTVMMRETANRNEEKCNYR